MHIHAQFSPRRVMQILAVAFGFVLSMHLVVQAGHLLLGWPMRAMTMLFDMDGENNLPTFFNAGLLFMSAALFYLAGRGEEGRVRRGWYLLAVVFVFLGIDEGSQVHEQFMLVTLRALGWDGSRMGWLYYAWVIPYGAALLVLGVALIRFLLEVSAGTRNRLLVSAAVYVLGAVVCEMWSGAIAEEAADTDLPYNAAYCAVITLEESLEMIGLMLCIRTLMRVHALRSTVLTLSASPSA